MDTFRQRWLYQLLRPHLFAITLKTLFDTITGFMAKHSHQFVENHTGLVGFGLDRETDENTVIYCLQKFSDDRLMELLRKKLTDEELSEIFNLIMRVLKAHLSDAEYHSCFLKDENR